MKQARPQGPIDRQIPPNHASFAELRLPPGGWQGRCLGEPVVRKTMHRAGSPSETGFTLVELMITVAIIGVLALLATVGYARWARAAKAAEATAMLGSIKGSQETYRGESLRYLDVSVGNIDTHYPTTPPSSNKEIWNPAACSAAVCLGFRTLNIQADGAVYYRYSAVAGAPTGAAPNVGGRAFPVANDPWFVAKAVGNLNDDQKQSQFWISSFESTVTSVDSDE